MARRVEIPTRDPPGCILRTPDQKPVVTCRRLDRLSKVSKSARQYQVYQRDQAGSSDDESTCPQGVRNSQPDNSEGQGREWPWRLKNQWSLET